MIGDRLSIQEAKDQLLIPDLWQRLSLRGDCKRQPCRAPWREDKRPSLSIYDGGRRFKDHGTGKQGDVIDFLAAVTGTDTREAARTFLAMVDGVAIHVEPDAQQPKQWQRQPDQGKPVLPADTHHGSEAELHRLASLRGLSLEAIRRADACGLLLFGTVCSKPSWLILDATRSCIQARRIDGQSYPAFEHVAERKAHTLRGSCQNWPLGAQEAARFRVVVLVEGGPDLLAAQQFIASEGRGDEVWAVALLGASNHVHEQALIWLAEKRVRIFPHADTAGEAAALRWARQLERVGCEVDAFAFDGLRRADGGAVGDLNDLAAVHPDDFEAERADLERILP